MTFFQRVVKTEVIKARICSFVLGAALVSALIKGNAEVRTAAVVLFVMGVLMLATHYSRESIAYRSYRKLERWERGER